MDSLVGEEQQLGGVTRVLVDGGFAPLHDADPLPLLSIEDHLLLKDVLLEGLLTARVHMGFKDLLEVGLPEPLLFEDDALHKSL